MRLLSVVISCVLLLAGCSGEAVQRPVTNAAPPPPPSSWPPAPPPPPGAPPPPQSITAVAPVYPGFEAVYGIQGTVVLLILVGKDGDPLDIRVDYSSGSRGLDRAAIAAATQWRFSPERKNGIAVEGYARVPVTFNEPMIKGDPAWTPAYRHAPIQMDDAPIPYATVVQAVSDVAARAHAQVYDSTHKQSHVYAIRDSQKIVRELWYFTDISTDRAMVVRYIFAGTPDNPITLAATLCNNASLCRQRESWVKAGPYTKRVSTE
ncbi:energy transducer TonB [Rhodanobacter hydrolyticus]|uniref:Energy transducer TonB n=1 Tax=Rhodanobacter hydrolyticus TaxID=2250595 RepID=A0ABW8JBQ4_9GAMM